MVITPHVSGNARELDNRTSEEVFDVLRSINRANGVTIVVVTHDPLVSEHVSRTVAIRDGRTSTEVVRRTEIDASGAHTTIAEEFVVLDRAGRLQLPHDYVEKLDLESRVRLTLDPDHINVWPDRDGVSEGNSNGTDRSREADRERSGDE
jgi:putative ABC transport system ATP-binding protein